MPYGPPSPADSMHAGSLFRLHGRGDRVQGLFRLVLNGLCGLLRHAVCVAVFRQHHRAQRADGDACAHGQKEPPYRHMRTSLPHRRAGRAAGHGSAACHAALAVARAVVAGIIVRAVIHAAVAVRAVDIAVPGRGDVRIAVVIRLCRRACGQRRREHQRGQHQDQAFFHEKFLLLLRIVSLRLVSASAARGML